jgi:D-alanine-D-alanine ligase
MTGYARIDFRVGEDGVPFVLEANANPNLEREEDFADAALARRRPRTRSSCRS